MNQDQLEGLSGDLRMVAARMDASAIKLDEWFQQTRTTLGELADAIRGVAQSIEDGRRSGA